MKRIFIFSLIALCCISTIAQSFYETSQTYNSSVYQYSIMIPKTFIKTASNSSNIDLKFKDQYGATILVNVTPRLPEEYKMTPFDQTKVFLETSMRSVAPNYTITRIEKIYVDNQKALLTESTGGVNPRLKMIDCLIYYKDKVYLITGTAEIARFDNYRQLFENAIKSIDFK